MNLFFLTQVLIVWEKKKGEDGKRGMFFIRYQNQVVYITFNTSFLEL